MSEEMLKHFVKVADDFNEAAMCGLPDEFLSVYRSEISDPLDRLMERVAPLVGEEWHTPTPDDEE